MTIGVEEEEQGIGISGTGIYKGALEANPDLLHLSLFLLLTLTQWKSLLSHTANCSVETSSDVEPTGLIHIQLQTLQCLVRQELLPLLYKLIQKR